MGKINKDIQIGKEEVKLSLSTNVMVLYVEYLKDSTKKTAKTNKFNQVARYKVNTQKLVSLLITNKE